MDSNGSCSERSPRTKTKLLRSPMVSTSSALVVLTPQTLPSSPERDCPSVHIKDLLPRQMLRDRLSWTRTRDIRCTRTTKCSLVLISLTTSLVSERTSTTRALASTSCSTYVRVASSCRKPSSSQNLTEPRFTRYNTTASRSFSLTL